MAADTTSWMPEKPVSAKGADHFKMLRSTGELHECGTDTNKISFYSDQCDLYDDDMVAYDYQAYRYAAITVHKYLDGNEEAEILDIGAGSGLISRELRKLGTYPNIDGIDPAKDFLNRGIELGRFRTTWNEYFFDNCKLVPYESYDVVVSSGCFGMNHLPPSSIYEMSRILKKGGILVLVVRQRYMLPGGGVSDIPVIFDKFESGGVMEKYEWSVLSRYFCGDPGRVICYKKL